MKKFSSTGALLLASAMAVCAFALPSAASAASWGPFGTHHTLDSLNLGFSSSSLGGRTSFCARTAFTANVASPQNLEITSASFSGCTIVGASIGTCTGTLVPTRFPWTATAVSIGNIQIHGIHIDEIAEQSPGGGGCLIAGSVTTLTGTLSGGTWTGNASHAMDFSNAEGLVAHSTLGNGVPVTLRAFFTDTQALVVN